MDLAVRAVQPDDRASILAIARTVAAEGDTYAFEADVEDSALLDYWMGAGVETWVMVRDEKVVAMSAMRPNGPGPVAHLATASFAVGPEARRSGVGRALAEATIAAAETAGYTGMIFHRVISTNIPAVALWTTLGFEVVGSIPGGFRHPKEGFVDSYMMYRCFADPLPAEDE